MISGSHWVALLFDVENIIFEYYDPMGVNSESNIEITHSISMIGLMLKKYIVVLDEYVQNI